MFQIEPSLNYEQQFWFDRFDECLQKRLSYLSSSEDRGWGKTTVLNEIGFTYQALDYDVLLITEYPESNVHYATKYIGSIRDLYGVRTNKTICIFDEYRVFSEIRRKREFFINVIDELNRMNIPYVGFVTFNN